MDSIEITNISKEELILNWKYNYKILPGASLVVSEKLAKAFKSRFGNKVSGYDLPESSNPAMYAKQKSVAKRKPIPAILTPEEIAKAKEDIEVIRDKLKKQAAKEAQKEQ